MAGACRSNRLHLHQPAGELSAGTGAKRLADAVSPTHWRGVHGDFSTGRPVEPSRCLLSILPTGSKDTNRRGYARRRAVPASLCGRSDTPLTSGYAAYRKIPPIDPSRLAVDRVGCDCSSCIAHASGRHDLFPRLALLPANCNTVRPSNPDTRRPFPRLSNCQVDCNAANVAVFAASLPFPRLGPSQVDCNLRQPQAEVVHLSTAGAPASRLQRQEKNPRTRGGAFPRPTGLPANCNLSLRTLAASLNNFHSSANTELIAWLF